MTNKNEVKKDLYKSKNMAKFSHYVSGNLYYNVELADGTHQFPIPTIETIEIMLNLEGKDNMFYTSLSADLGTTAFYNEIKGSELIRWIDKAIDNENFIKIN